MRLSTLKSTNWPGNNQSELYVTVNQSEHLQGAGAGEGAGGVAERVGASGEPETGDHSSCRGEN